MYGKCTRAPVTSFRRPLTPLLSYCLYILTELINIFESFLPQLLRYPNAADPLNGEAAALFMRSPDEYARKVREHVKRYAGAKDAQDALEGGGEAEHGASGEDDDEDGEMSDMGEMSDDEAAGAMDM